MRGTSVYAVDWLGMGRSARVPFRIRAKRDNISERVREAESFFVESLEEWRERTGLEKMTLIGHSLGAYFSTVYALRYPQRVHKLILLSPAGVPRGPDTTSPSREMLDRQVTGEDGAVAADSSRVAALEEEQRVEKKKESFGRRLFTHLWEEGWSPFQVVRSSLFWGPMLVGKVRLGSYDVRLLGADGVGNIVLFTSLRCLERRRNARYARLYHEYHPCKGFGRILYLLVFISQCAWMGLDLFFL